MPLYSYECPACHWAGDRVATVAARLEQACVCGARLEKTLSRSAVSGDEIPGGFVQEHFGHAPEIFYSKREMARRAKELGLEPFVRHVDGDKHVARWI